MLRNQRVLVALLAGLCLALSASVQAADYEKYVPDDTEAVIQVNVKQAMAAPLLKEAMAALKAQLATAGGPLKEVGFDPFTDLHHVVIAVPGGGNAERAVVLVQGKFDVAKFEAHAEKAAAGELKVHKVGANKVFEGKVPVPQVGEQGVFFSFVDSTMIALANSKESVSDTIDRKTGKKKSGVKKEMQALIAKMDPKMTLSVAVLGTVAGQPDVSDKVNTITGGIGLTDEIKLDVTIAAKNADTAKELEMLIAQGLDQAKQILPIVAANQKQLAPVVDLLGIIKVAAAGSNVTIQGQLTKDDIEKALKKAGG